MGMSLTKAVKTALFVSTIAVSGSAMAMDGMSGMGGMSGMSGMQGMQGQEDKKPEGKKEK